MTMLVATGCSMSPSGSARPGHLGLEMTVWRDFFATRQPENKEDYIHLRGATGLWGPYDAWKTGIEDYLASKFEGIAPSTLTNFVQANSITRNFATDASFGPGVLLVHTGEIDQILSQNQNGWDAYYKAHPKSVGCAVVSRVGFSDDQTEAILYYEIQSHRLAGVGYYILLRIENGRWTDVSSFTDWVS